MKKVKGAWDREDDRNGGATNELYAGRRDQESCKGCAKAEAEVERLKAELARRVDHGGVIRERAGHDRDRDVELRQAEAEVERRRESELRATEAWERTVASNIEITQRAEKAEAEVERLRKHQRAITDSALRYDEAVGRLCPRDEIIDYHDDLLLAIEAAREGE